MEGLATAAEQEQSHPPTLNFYGTLTFVGTSVRQPSQGASRTDTTYWDPPRPAALYVAARLFVTGDATGAQGLLRDAQLQYPSCPITDLLYRRCELLLSCEDENVDAAAVSPAPVTKHQAGETYGGW